MILRRLSTVLARAEDGLAALNLAAVFGLVSYEMAARTLFGSSLPWAEEMSRVLLISLVYISAVGLTRSNGHIRVEFIVTSLPDRLQGAAIWLSDLLCLAFALTATWLGVIFVRESMRFNLSFAHSDLPFPVWVAQLIVPVGFALISLRLVLRLLGARSGAASNPQGT